MIVVYLIILFLAMFFAYEIGHLTGFKAGIRAEVEIRRGRALKETDPVPPGHAWN